MLIERDTNHLISSRSDQGGTLLVVGILEKLLTEIVAKGIFKMLVGIM